MSIRENEIKSSVETIVKSDMRTAPRSKRAAETVVREILDKGFGSPCSTSLQEHNLKFKEVSGLLRELVNVVRAESKEKPRH